MKSPLQSIHPITPPPGPDRPSDTKQRFLIASPRCSSNAASHPSSLLLCFLQMRSCTPPKGCGVKSNNAAKSQSGGGGGGGVPTGGPRRSGQEREQPGEPGRHMGSGNPGAPFVSVAFCSGSPRGRVAVACQGSRAACASCLGLLQGSPLDERGWYGLKRRRKRMEERKKKKTHIKAPNRFVSSLDHRPLPWEISARARD